HPMRAHKCLELLKPSAPPAARVGILWNPANPSTAPQLKTADAAAAALGLTVLPVAVKGPRSGDVDRAFATIEKEHVRSLLVIGCSTLGVQRDRIGGLWFRPRLPHWGSQGRWG